MWPGLDIQDAAVHIQTAYLGALEIFRSMKTYIIQILMPRIFNHKDTYAILIVIKCLIKQKIR